jgi:hypothetical protein
MAKTNCNFLFQAEIEIFLTKTCGSNDSTLDSGINLGPKLINFGFFPGPTALLKDPTVY